MAKIDFDLDDLTNAALKRLVKQLLVADDAADLHEEMHGRPNTPMVTDDDLPYDGDDELPDVPKKKGKK